MSTESQKLLEQLFPSRLALSPDELAPLLSTTGHRIRLAIQEGWWPIPHRRVGRRILFPLPLIAGYLDGAGEARDQTPSEVAINLPSAKAQPPKRRRGRPDKTAPTSHKHAKA